MNLRKLAEQRYNEFLKEYNKLHSDMGKLAMSVNKKNKIRR